VIVPEEVFESQDTPIGLYVTQVVVDSPAMVAGIQNGDVILQIGDTEIFTIQDYERAVLESSAGEEVIVRGKRRGADGYVEIEFTILVGSQL